MKKFLIGLVLALSFSLPIAAQQIDINVQFGRQERRHRDYRRPRVRYEIRYVRYRWRVYKETWRVMYLPNGRVHRRLVDRDLINRGY